MGSFFLFVKKWVLPVSADLEDRKNEIFTESLGGIDNAQLPAHSAVPACP
jgi:hypothetical protein